MKKSGKSIFVRIFSINLVVIIVSYLVLAVMQTVLISQFAYRERINSLKDNARTIAKYIEEGTSPEPLNSFLHGFSHSTKINILIIDNAGNILLSAAQKDVYDKSYTKIDEKYRKNVMLNRDHLERGNLGGVYRTDMFTLQVPIVAKQQEAVIGAIYLSVPVPEMTNSQKPLYRILLLSLFFVVLVSMVLSFALSRRISKPIKKIGNTAKQFAQGDFASRVELDEKTDNIIEINELTETFNDMAFSLEKSDDIRNNFLSDVAHELRTPMTTISGFVDGILDDTIPPEKQKDYLMIVKDEVARLSGLVNSFLDLTRLETGNQALEITNFDVNETIRRTLVGLESRLEEKNININLNMENEQQFVRADMNSIRQVMTNLIENAIKFTNQGGEIRISTAAIRHEVKISVYNTGCGISPEDIKMIFERFYKADKSRSQNREGTGIGLYIVKDILNRHGKNITVESQEGEYAEFVFTLDRAKN